MNIIELEARHKKEIQALQDKCKHTKAEWVEVIGCPGASCEERICQRCGKTVDSRAETIASTFDHYGQWRVCFY